MKEERVVYGGRIAISKKELLIKNNMSVEDLANYWLENTQDKNVLELNLLSKIKERDLLNSEIENLKETLNLINVPDNEILDQITNKRLIKAYDNVINLYNTQRNKARDRKKELTLERYLNDNTNRLIPIINDLNVTLKDFKTGIINHYNK